MAKGQEAEKQAPPTVEGHFKGIKNGVQGRNLLHPLISMTASFFIFPTHPKEHQSQNKQPGRKATIASRPHCVLPGPMFFQLTARLPGGQEGPPLR